MVKKDKNPKLRTNFYFVVSVFLIISSLLLLRWHVNDENYRSNLKKTGVKITALVVTRSEIEYPTSEGKIRTKPIVSPAQGTLKRFSSVTAYYDKNNVKKVVIEQDDSAFNITMYVVATKLFVVGFIFLYFGLRRMKKYSRDPSLRSG